MNLDEGNKVFHLPFTFKVSTKTLNNMSNIFKVNNKDTRTTSDVSVINFEHILHFIIIIIVEFNQLNACLA